MMLIDGDRIVTVQLYDDEHEEFTEKKMSIIDYINAYTNEGVTTADDVLGKIRAEIEQLIGERNLDDYDYCSGLICARNIIDKYRTESREEKMTPTKRQIEYAEYLAQRMCQDLPKEYTKQAYSDFISKWKPAVMEEDAEMNEPDEWQMQYM